MKIPIGGIRSELCFVRNRVYFPYADFWPASKFAIECRIRSAVTQAEVAIAIATSLRR
jgi:hypothetical protein